MNSRWPNPAFLGQAQSFGGQALIEALILLPCLLLLLFAMHALSRWQLQALSLRAEVRQQVLQQAVLGNTSAQSAMGDLAWGLSSSPTAATAEGRQLWTELDLARSQWVRAQGDRVAELDAPFALAAASEVRKSVVLHWWPESGQSASTTETRQRIRAGQQTWQLHGGRAEQLGQSLASRLAPLEQGWGQRRPRTDWLDSWQDTLPVGVAPASGAQP